MKSASHRQRPARLKKTLAPAVGLATGVLLAAILPTQIAAALPSTAASDSFTRSVASGWGTPPVGGAWTTSKSGSAKFSVSSGHGVVSQLTRGSSATATFTKAVAGDVDMAGTIGMPSRASTLYTALELRTQHDGSRYRGRLTVGSTGSATLSVSRVNKKTETNLTTIKLPFTVKPSSAVHLEYQVTGTTSVAIEGRAWLSGASVPAWQLTTTDSSASRIAASGHMGLWEYAGSGNTAAVTTTLDNVTVQANPAQPVTPPAAPPATSPVTTPPATTPPATTSPVIPADASAGSAPIGSTAYAIPAGAVFVSTSGSDFGDGSLSNPYLTIGKAVSAASSGQTIVIRGGVYNESVTVPASKSLTIQSYPHEAVWLDGSKAVTSWTKTSTGWTTPWNFFPSNVIDGIADNPRYVAPAYPLAARTDMAFDDGSQLTQVASASLVTTGTFAVDSGSGTVTVGSDPSGHEMRIANLSQAFFVQSPNTTIRGIGVRRYASTAATVGAVRFSNSGATVQNVDIEDTAYIGINVSNNAGTLDHITVKRAGQLGVGVNASYGFSITDSVVDENDYQHFKAAPVSGGLKITRSRGVTITGNVFDDNNSSGIWCDESCYDVTVANNQLSNNTDDGISIELSQKVVIANNTVQGSGADINIIDTGDVQIMNNSLGSATTFAIRLAQDSRTADQTSVPGHDPRQPVPDPTVPWITKGVKIENNAFGTSGNGYQIYGLDMVDKQVTITGNMFNRRVTTANPTLVAWGTSATTQDYVHVQSPEALNQVAGASWTNQQTDEALPLVGMLSALVQAAPTTATPLPASIASIVGQPAGTKHIGAF